MLAVAGKCIYIIHDFVIGIKYINKYHLPGIKTLLICAAG